jgi:hypothetical protein
MLDVAPRIIWFEPPERALADAVRFMAEALDRAPPGIIDPRSWAYLISKMGRYPPPPLPKRHFEGERVAALLADGSRHILHADRSSCDNLEETRRAAREAGLKLRQTQPKDDLEEIKRCAREDWPAKRGPGGK